MGEMISKTRHAKTVVPAAIWIAAIAVCGTGVAHAQHSCEAPGDAAWRVVASVETIAVANSAPFQAGGDWVIDRTITLLPLCNYFNSVGNYSLRSYALDPMEKKERVVLCRAAAAGSSAPVAPYAGPCPPK
jgi:hypothetical protein